MALTRQTDKARTTAMRITRSRQDEPATLIRLIHVPANDILPFPIQFGVSRLKALTMSDFKQALNPDRRLFPCFRRNPRSLAARRGNPVLLRPI